MLRDAVAGAAASFRGLLGHPADVQHALLMDIIRRNASCAFGLAHGFSSIRTASDFSRQVPLRAYEDFAPQIAQATSGGAWELASEPILAFEETGGSTAGPKHVPYTAAGLAGFQRGLRPWLDDLFTHFPQSAQGRHYWSISPACRPVAATRGGVSIGLPGGDAAYFGDALEPAITQSLAVPAEVGAIADVAAWRRATLLHLLASEDVALVSVWSPSFLLQLLSHGREQANELVEILQESGRVSPGRAAVLRAVLSTGTGDLTGLWPRLAVISCWDQASAAAGAQTLRGLFPHAVIQGKGLLATEGLFTIPLYGCDWPVVALESAYFEFQDAGGCLHGAEDLAKGDDYRLVVTTASGLYRYEMGDVVRVKGFAERTPMLEFRGRGAGTADLCGEKLSEPFVLEVLAALKQPFAVLAADGAAPGYLLLLDAAALTGLGGADPHAQEVTAHAESLLARNPQYAHARAVGQLRPLRAVLCHEPERRWLDQGMARGQRLGDIKLPALMVERAQWEVLAA